MEPLSDRDQQVMDVRAADSAPHAYAVRNGSKRGPLSYEPDSRPYGAQADGSLAIPADVPEGRQIPGTAQEGFKILKFEIILFDFLQMILGAILRIRFHSTMQIPAREKLSFCDMQFAKVQFHNQSPCEFRHGYVWRFGHYTVPLDPDKDHR